MRERRVPPPRLLGTVTGNLRPVRPYFPPLWRTLALLPVGIVLLVGIPIALGLRPNLPLLGRLGSWGLSTVQMLAGLGIVGLGLREAVPGRELSRRALLGLAAGAFALFVAVTLASAWLAPVPGYAPPVWVYQAIGCFRMAASWGLPAFAIAALLVMRAAPTRPLVAVAACGLGTGLMVDAGMRLWCGVSTVSHVLVGHGAVIVVLVAVGALAGLALDRVRGRLRRREGDPSSTPPPPRPPAP
jgi:hypothetical protein